MQPPTTTATILRLSDNKTPSRRRLLFDFLLGNLLGIFMAALALGIDLSVVDSRNNGNSPQVGQVIFRESASSSSSSSHQHTTMRSPSLSSSLSDPSITSEQQQHTPVQVITDGEWWRAPPRIRRDPTILCVILPSPITIDLSVPVVNATWGTRCSRFMSASLVDASVWDPNKKALTWTGLRHVLAQIQLTEDVLLIGADDAYVVVDNWKMYHRGRLNEKLYVGRNVGNGVCDIRAMSLSQSVVSELQKRFSIENDASPCSATADATGAGATSATGIGMMISEITAESRLGACMASLSGGLTCTDAIDARGKRQVMIGNPFTLFRKPHYKLALEHDKPECCSVLPMAFLGVAYWQPVKTGKYNSLYLLDYFLRRTAVAGYRSGLRPLVDDDTGADVQQVGYR